MIKEITTFIRDQALLLPTPVILTIDTDLFAGHRSQGIADACDVVLESSGGSVFPELPERADVVFQVLSRAKTYMTARARAWAIYDAIYRDWAYGSAGWTLPLISSDSISSCDAPDADWTVSAGGVKSTDNVDFKEGVGSLKNTVAGPGIGTTYLTVYNPIGTWDLSTKEYVFCWLKCDRANVVFTQAILVIYDTAAKYRYWNLTFLAEEWIAVKKLLSVGDGETPIPPDLTLITKIQLSFKAADIIPFYKKIDHVRVGIEEYEAMIIEPLATPQYIGQDEKRRYEFSTNYLMKIKKL